jgi:glycopeptide antibiotics resistance protein
MLADQGYGGLPAIKCAFAGKPVSMHINSGNAQAPIIGRCQVKRSLIALLIWVTVIVMAGTWPFDNFVGHAHWQYIKWIPTAEDIASWKYLLDIGSDIVANTALFFPLGYLLTRLRDNRNLLSQLFFAAALGGALSVGIEYYQVYCHNRFPSIFDVITNVAGSVFGARFAHFNTAYDTTERVALSK